MRALLAAALVVSSVGCASARCGFIVTGGSPVLEVGYVSGGDGPTATILRLYSGVGSVDAAVLEFEPLGLRRRCSAASGADVEALRRSVEAEAFRSALLAESSKATDLGIHPPVVSIERDRFLVQRQPEQLDRALLEVLQSFEALFRNRFPSLASRFLPFSVGGPAHGGVSSNISLKRTSALSRTCRLAQSR